MIFHKADQATQSGRFIVRRVGGKNRHFDCGFSLPAVQSPVVLIDDIADFDAAGGGHFRVLVRVAAFDPGEKSETVQNFVSTGF